MKPIRKPIAKLITAAMIRLRRVLRNLKADGGIFIAKLVSLANSHINAAMARVISVSVRVPLLKIRYCKDMPVIVSAHHCIQAR